MNIWQWVAVIAFIEIEAALVGFVDPAAGEKRWQSALGAMSWLPLLTVLPVATLLTVLYRLSRWLANQGEPSAA